MSGSGQTALQGFYPACNLLLCHFASALLYCVSRIIASPYVIPFSPSSVSISPSSSEYINENYAQPLSMQSVCDEIGISQTCLSRLFRKYSDTTFNAYLTRCRMEAAMNLLRDKPDLLLRDVAACVGYDDSSYFTKVFHQYTGKTPSQFTSDT